MKIKIYNNNEKIMINFNGKDEEISFNILDALIEEFIKIDTTKDIEYECDESDELLKNYKNLIVELSKEVAKDDFKNAYDSLIKENITNEEIEKILKEK